MAFKVNVEIRSKRIERRMEEGFDEVRDMLEVLIDGLHDPEKLEAMRARLAAKREALSAALNQEKQP